MGILSSLAVRRPKLVLALYALVVVVSLVGVGRLREEDNLLVFLPTQDRDVKLFQEVSRRFGGLRVGLIGLEARPDDDVFSPENMTRLQAATDAIRNVTGVDRTLSLTTVTDPALRDDGVELQPLVGKPPADAKEASVLREKVLSREFVTGSLVSQDGRAALILAFFAEGASDRAVSDGIRRAALTTLKPLSVYFGGAPFAGRAIYEEAQRDVWRLSPFALAILLIVVILSFHDIVGVLLTIGSVCFSTLVVLGGMGLVGETFTVASSTLPVILFASGSSYAVHVLGRYYLVRTRAASTDAIKEALRIVGPPLAIAAATTSVGFFSFVFTDVRPMRAFGIACGAGVLICWLTSLTLVPAVLAIWPRRAAGGAQLPLLGALLVWVWKVAKRRRVWVVGTAVLIGALAIAPARRVTVRMEPRGFFSKGSEPWLAQQFLDQRFGGSTFVQVALHGDFDDPATLREVDRLADFARALPGVTQVQAITQPLRLIDEVMGSGNRLPATPAQASNLYFFLESEAGIRSMLSHDRRDALVHVRMRGDGREAVEALETYVRERLRKRPVWPTRLDVAERLGWIARAAGHEPRLERISGALATGWLPADDDPSWQYRKAEVLIAFDGPDGAMWAPGAKEERLVDARRQMGVMRLLPDILAKLGLGRPEASQVLPVLDDLLTEGPSEFRAREELTAQIAGEPILERGFSHSVSHNLDLSLAISILAVFALLYLLFRSVRTSLLCMFPSLLTLAMLFAGMGLFNIHIDLGTSLVAGIATGAGSDFAMHYLWYLRRQRADEVSRSVGPVMVVSILLVALGFIVLALGRSPAMHLLGTLAGVSMALAALLTCLIVPALYNREGNS